MEPVKKVGAQVKDLSRVKSGFKSVALQFYFEIAGLASAEKWRKIQNTLSPRKLAIQSSRNSQIRVLQSCSFPPNSRS